MNRTKPQCGWSTAVSGVTWHLPGDWWCHANCHHSLAQREEGCEPDICVLVGIWWLWQLAVRRQEGQGGFYFIKTPLCEPNVRPRPGCRPRRRTDTNSCTLTYAAVHMLPFCVHGGVYYVYTWNCTIFLQKQSWICCMLWPHHWLMRNLLACYGQKKKKRAKCFKEWWKCFKTSPLCIFVRATAPVTGAAPAVSEDKWSIRQLLNSLHLFFPPSRSLSPSSPTQRVCLTLHAENLRGFWPRVFMNK